MISTRLRLAAIALILAGCHSAPAANGPKQEQWRIGETAYVCGCPMACCPTMSREPGGRCLCNVPLKEGKVVAVVGGRVDVTFEGRTKTFHVGE